MPDHEPSFYTAKQVAGILKLAPVTVRQIAYRRGLGQRFSERVLLFSEADIDDMRQRNRPGRPKIQRKSVHLHKDKSNR